MFTGRRYCLFRLSFELNVVLQIMKAIIGTVLSQEDKVKERACAFLNDNIRIKLAQFTMICKDSEWLENNTHLLGLDVHGEQETLQWRWETVVPEVPNVLTRLVVFSLCDRILGYLPVCGKHYKAQGKYSPQKLGWWDYRALACLYGNGDHSKSEEEQSHQRRWVHSGKRDKHLGWCQLQGDRVLLEKNGAVTKDMRWLRPMNDAAHINLAELDAVLKGINLAL